jgi:hypothetical protein
LCGSTIPTVFGSPLENERWAFSTFADSEEVLVWIERVGQAGIGDRGNRWN